MKTGYRVKAYKHAKMKWVVRGKENGKWVRRFFATKGEASTYAEIKNTELLNLGLEGKEFPLALRVMATECETRLAEFGKTLRDAVDFYIPHLARASKARPVEEVVKEALASKTADGLKKPTLIEFGHRCGLFSKAFPARDIGSLGQEEIEKWLRTSCPNPVTRNNTRKTVVNLAQFRGKQEIHRIESSLGNQEG